MGLFLIAIAWTCALGAGFFDSLCRIYIKDSKVHTFTLLCIGLLFALPSYLVWLFFEGVPPFDANFWIAVVIHVPLLSIATICMVEAHRISPLTLTVPYLSLTPAFLLGVNPLMGMMFPELKAGKVTLLGIAGVMVITFGLYVLNFEKLKVPARSEFRKHFRKAFRSLRAELRKELPAPFRAFRKEKGSQLMLVTATLFSFTACLDYVAWTHSNAPFYLFVDHGLASMVMGVLILVYVGSRRLTENTFSPKGHWKGLIFFGIVFSFSVTIHMLAFEHIPNVPYVVVGKRTGSILFTILLGLYLGYVAKRKNFLEERMKLKYRLPGALIAVIGMIIVVIWGRI